MPDSIPKGYVKSHKIEEDGKLYQVYYNPVEKDVTKAYIKCEVAK